MQRNHVMMTVRNRYCQSIDDETPRIGPAGSRSLLVRCCECKQQFFTDMKNHTLCDRCGYQLCPDCSNTLPVKQTNAVPCTVQLWAGFAQLYANCHSCNKIFKIATFEEINSMPLAEYFMSCPDCRAAGKGCYREIKASDMKF